MVLGNFMDLVTEVLIFKEAIQGIHMATTALEANWGSMVLPLDWSM